MNTEMSHGAATGGQSWADDVDSDLSRETRALLACAAAILEPDRLPAALQALEACPDVDALCRKAGAHGMIGHLNQVLAVQGGEAARRLSVLQRSLAERGLRQTARLLPAMQLLEQAGIDIMPYKGPVWAERFYGDLTLRNWSDIDVLVPFRRVADARRLLVENGFTDSHDFNGRLLTQRGRGGGEIALSEKDGDVHLEIHWDVAAGSSRMYLRAESLIGRGERLDLLGRQVLTPCPVDAFLITCLNGAKDHWESVEGLLCAAVQIRDTAPTAWAQMLSAAKRAGCLRRTVVAVAHVSRVFGPETPVAVAAVLARDKAAQALLSELSPRGLDAGHSLALEPQLGLLHWRFASEDSLVARLAHGARRFFQPGPEDWSWLVLPPGSRWLYRVLRPGRLAVKWAKRL